MVLFELMFVMIVLGVYEVEGRCVSALVTVVVLSFDALVLPDVLDIRQLMYVRIGCDASGLRIKYLHYSC